jgi:hypothetical protein
MRSPFSLEGELSRPAYAVASAVAFFSQHALVALILTTLGEPLSPPPWFWLTPLRAIVLSNQPLSPMVLLSAAAMTLLIDWLLVVLAFRRARQARGHPGLAALVVAPGLQVFVMLWLCFAPPGGFSPDAPETDAPSAVDWRSTATASALGMLAGVILSIAAVAFSTLFLRLYGYGLFIASPFVIGMTTAYLANRHADVGGNRTITLVLCSLGLGGLALLGLAFEGVICLLIASPLIAAMGVVGGLFGRALARMGTRRRGGSLMSIAFVPLLMVGEAALPPRADFDNVASIEVDAPPAAVWDAVVHMGPIPDAPAAPFRWGLAYPMRGEIMGTGVGALRRGVFSTGVAYEKVTEWEPDRKLSFIVLSDPPTMREFSPYQHVNAPHQRGYFKTLDARFTITPLADGKTRLSLATRHELDLEPALYWTPFAIWATHANKARVLRHFRQQAEASTVR